MPTHADDGLFEGTASSAIGDRVTSAPGVALGRDDVIGLLRALEAIRDGDFSVRLPSDRDGLAGRIATTFNDIVATNQRMAGQLERVGQVVGKEGKTRQRVRFGPMTGAWLDMENSVNSLIDDLLWPTTEVSRTIEAATPVEMRVAG